MSSFAAGLAVLLSGAIVGAAGAADFLREDWVYSAGKRIMAEGRANSVQLANLLFHRLLMLQTEWMAVDQACIPSHMGSGGGGSSPRQCKADSGSAGDYSNFLMDLNSGRYGVANAGDYRLKIPDLQRANKLQFLDPVFLVAAYRYGSDYIGRAQNQSRIPMIPLPGTGLAYLPGFRVDLSPFGIEYIKGSTYVETGLGLHL